MSQTQPSRPPPHPAEPLVARVHDQLRPPAARAPRSGRAVHAVRVAHLGLAARAEDDRAALVQRLEEGVLGDLVGWAGGGSVALRVV
jgi:hypothetical protein